MKVDFSTVLKNLEGDQMKERAGPQSVALALLEAGVSQMMVERALAVLKGFWNTGDEPKETLLTACRVAANALQAADNAVSGAERVDRMRLAIKLMDPAQPVEVSAAEREKILKAVEKTYDSPIIYFRMSELFDEAAAAQARMPKLAEATT